MKNKNKDKQQSFLALSVALGFCIYVIYTLAAFYQMSLNPAVWDLGARALVTACVALACIFYAFCIAVEMHN